MKRTIAAICAVLLCVCLVACGEKEASKPLSDIYADIQTQVELTDMLELDSASKLDKYYGIAQADVAEYAGGINNTGVEMEEIVLIKAVDNAAAQRVKEALDVRYSTKLAQNKDYNPEQAQMIEQCSVEQDGVYVTMIVSENADTITQVYKSYF